jgi:hypothetical protein
MAKMGDWRQNHDEMIPLDGIGGVNIIVKADVHRSGINFPCYAFENQAETEGFAKMAKRAGYGISIRRRSLETHRQAVFFFKTCA